MSLTHKPGSVIAYCSIKSFTLVSISYICLSANGQSRRLARGYMATIKQSIIPGYFKRKENIGIEIRKLTSVSRSRMTVWLITVTWDYYIADWADHLLPHLYRQHPLNNEFKLKFACSTRKYQKSNINNTIAFYKQICFIIKLSHNTNLKKLQLRQITLSY